MQSNARRRLRLHQHRIMTRSCIVRRAMDGFLDQRAMALLAELVLCCQWILENVEMFQLSMLFHIIHSVLYKS